MFLIFYKKSPDILKIRGFFYSFLYSFFLSSLFSSSLSLANDLSAALDSKDSSWHSLLHYDQTIFGSYKSMAKNREFFISKEGSSNPSSEMKESLTAFKKDKELFCKFPARVLYFQKKGIKFPYRLETCKDYKEFYEQISPSAISLVFSSYRLSGAATAFGHTFFRVKRKDVKRRSQDQSEISVLDLAVNYAASVTTSNAFLYGVMGAFGGFRGDFSVMPYYYKVREYSDYESRDLWDFELKFSQEDLDFFVAHLFEMKFAHFDYYYLDGNCASMLILFLDAIKPEWNLKKKLPFFLVTPLDSIAILMDVPWGIKRVRFTPSLHRRFETRLSNLDTRGKKILKSVLKDKNPLLSNSAEVLDTAIDYYDFIYAKELVEEDKKIMAFKNKFLVVRSKLDSEDDLKFSPPIEELPGSGHKTSRLGLGYIKKDDHKLLYALELRPTLHDLLDAPQGHIPDASLEMGKIKALYFEDEKKFRISELTLVSATSLKDFNEFTQNLSFKFSLGLKKENFDLDPFLATHVNAGVGMSAKRSYFLLSFFLNNDFLFSRHIKFSLSPELFFLIRPSFPLGIMGSYKYHYHYLKESQEKSFEHEYRLGLVSSLSKSFNLSFEYFGAHQNKGISLSLYRYF